MWRFTAITCALLLAVLAVASPSFSAPTRYQTQTATVTTGSAFVVSHIFDLGNPTVAAVRFTLLSANADGERWGTTIAVDVQSLQHSRDGIAWMWIGTTDGYGLYRDQPGGPGTFDMAALVLSPRYLRVQNVRIIDPTTYNVYAGPNHPAATVRLDVEFL